MSSKDDQHEERRVVVGVVQTNNRHCKQCDRNDSFDNMVCCDGCESWEHYGCAGVTDSIAQADRSWRCRQCKKEDQSDRTKSVLSFAGSSVSKGSRRSQRQLQLSLELLEAQKELQRKRLEEEEKHLQLQKKRLQEEEEYLKQKFALLMQIEDGDDAVSRRSSVSAKSKRDRLEKWLEKGAGTEVNSNQVGTSSSQQPTTVLQINEDVDRLGARRKVSSLPQVERKSVPENKQKFQQYRPPNSSTPNLADHPLEATVCPNTEVPTTTRVSAPAFPPNTFEDPKTQYYGPASEAVPTYSSVDPSLLYAPISSTHPSVSFANPKALERGIMCAKTIDSLSSSTASIAYSTVNTLGGAFMCSSSLRFGTTPTYTSNVNAGMSRSPVRTQTQPITSLVSGFHPSIPSVQSASNVCHTIPGQTQIFPPSNASSQGRTVVHEPGNSVRGPTSVQLAARSVVQRELPRFSGNPQEWPLFYSAFKNTTDICGYSNEENLARLQRCLEGHAKESVQSRLLIPASVPHVMETLRRLYGRPELLINSLLRKLRDTPSPKADNLNSIVKYGLAVQNLVEHVIISEQHAHLSNPILLQELVEKLPIPYQMQWGCFKRTRMDVNLATFNEFMADMMNVAADLTINVEFAQSQARPPRTERKSKEKLFVHASESAQSVNHVEVNGEPPAKTCAYCGESSHLILNCVSFKSLDVDGRWKAVNQKKLCRTCLVPHWKGSCRSKKECGVDGCRIRHNYLLHSVRRFSNTQTPASTSQIGRTIHQNHHHTENYTFFRYVPVTLFGNGTKVDTFAFLDDGSSATLIESSIAKQLGLSGETDTLWLCWTGKIGRNEKTSEQALTYLLT